MYLINEWIVQKLKKDFHKNHQDQLIEQIIDVVEQAHATNQFDDMDKPEVQTLMKDRLDGKRMLTFFLYSLLIFDFFFSFSVSY